MFKKLKDKLAEEVKSSPQRIQQFAQAAQAAVTSASSSISDITNSDLFSIGDNDSQPTRSSKSQSSTSSQNTFQDVALVQPTQTLTESTDYMPSQDILENQRQRRLSNSSFASDVSFRLPSYETPSMYHLQSDMEVSASEAEERGFSAGAVSLDRVTKEQLYAAYRRTQERYTKYRTQYGDLARHYKLLERENAKARSVLVETQDKALRRISELREQCALEQSAKAHLEKALRIELEEKHMKIETLNTKVQLLQSDANNLNMNKNAEGDNDVQLINLSNDNEVTQAGDLTTGELTALNTKIEKMEQLLNKYKDSHKISKEKNSQITTEMQILSNELENKNKEIEILKCTANDLVEAKNKIQELNSMNEELQNEINVYEFKKTRDQSTLQLDLQKAHEEIADLQGKIEIFTKREEEYAISLAENKLSIHKELENKENEIKSHKDSLDISKKEIQSLNIVLNDYKNNMALLEAEKLKLNNELNELATNKPKMLDMETKIEELSKKCHSLEQSKSKVEEEYKCLQLQFKQETAEKLAMIDRNVYLENRNTQLSEDNSKKSSQISTLEAELKKREKDLKVHALEDCKKDELFNELIAWKNKYAKLESEIQEERDELIKLQSEIEKLLVNHELLQTQNVEFRQIVSDLKFENVSIQEKLNKYDSLKSHFDQLRSGMQDLRKCFNPLLDDTKSLQKVSIDSFSNISQAINNYINVIVPKETDSIKLKYNDSKMENAKLESELKNTIMRNDTISKELNDLLDENNNLKCTIQEFESEKILLSEKVQALTEIYDKMLHEMNTTKQLNESLNSKIIEYESINKDLQIALQSEKSKYVTVSEKITIIENENRLLEERDKKITAENKFVTKELDTLKNEHKTIIDQLEPLKKDLEVKIKNMNKLQEDVETLSHENKLLKDQNEIKYQEMNIETNLAIEELNTMNKKYTNVMEELELVKKDNEECDRKTDFITKLQEQIKILTHENISLKSEAEKISSSFENMEVEINDLRQTHTEMEVEKDRLNEVIEKLESSQYKNTSSKDIQTEIWEEIHSTNSIDNQMSQQSIQINNELSDNYSQLKVENDLLKDENRRFKSDIEGLQTYLTKISKENSVLNDKLRESIATSEHSIENNHTPSEILELKNEIQLRKENIDDLMRENSLLIEENLELKDQLQSQNYPKSSSKLNDKGHNNDTIVEEKYNNLLQVNSSLEKRLIDLEQMNKSVNVNLLQMQDKNEKLRSSNEKLERRLDEALVSLRHLHSLQENTELEYLRNILYEYLTGSGLHSVTLAKVLSAIVKFDDMQTKLVLQKEKERQGFLRQLGII